MAYNIDESVECPFYIGDVNKPTVVICCEGTEANNGIKLAFPSKDDKTSYKDRYCRIKRWEKCVIAVALNGKYE